jgi:RNA polymerase sigma factor (sigma-70 family)
VTNDFIRAYDEHVWQVYGFFAYRLPSRADAEDLTQVTFERALKAWHRFDERRASLTTWLLAIARNSLIDHYRRERAVADPLPAEADGLGEEAGPEAHLGTDPELAAALATLTDREREVLALRFGGDLTGPEIAELMGLTLANVHQVMSRSLRKLRGALEGSELGGERAEAGQTHGGGG